MAPPDEKPQDFRFWAFISYSSKDAAMAKKLHRALETYSIPRDLRGRPGRDGPIPAKIFPIFRDRDELPLASDLGSTITDALRASRYLIVLCSPNSANSRWVDEEVRTFKAMGREDRILALILDGEPNVSDVPGKEALECFPPSLKVRIGPDGKSTGEPTEPIGGDLRKGGDGWTVAFLKAMAGITGLGYNAFARREQKRKRVRQALTAVALLALTSAGVWRWDYTRVKTGFFESFVLSNGVPTGLGPVDADRLSRRYMTYKIEESRRKVRRMTAVTPQGTPGDFSMVDASYVDGAEFGLTANTSSLVVNYREDGSVAAHNLQDATGREILRHVYSADLTVVELKNPFRDTAQTMAADSASVSRRGSGSNLGAADGNKAKTEIARWRVKRDSAGHVIEKSYENAWGDPTADRDGKAVVRYTRDSRGRMTGESATGLDSQVIEEVGSTVASSRQEYDSNGRLAFYRFMDRDGRPTSGPLGYAVEEIHYDTPGNVIERKFLDASGNVVSRRDGFSIFRATYNPKGQLLAKKFYDANGEPVLVQGFGCHEYRFETDAMDRNTGQAGFGVNGNPVITQEGWHRFTWDLDENGRQVRNYLFGVSGEPITNPREFWHSQSFTYDERGNLVELQLSGPDGKPVAGSEGTSRTTWVFDDANRPTSWRFFGADGLPCTDRNGVHETRCTYDARGNISRYSNFGSDRNPVLHHGGYHIMKCLYDERGNLVEESFYGTTEEPVVERTGRVHRNVYRYNSKGQWIETRLFDVAGRPAINPDEGHHITRYQFNPAGFITGEAWFDQDDKPMNRRSDSSHRYERTVDARGNVLTESSFDHNGRKILNSDGYHQLIQEFDSRGNELSESYFGTRGEPLNRIALGIHRISRTFNEKNQETSTLHTDASGAAAPAKGVFHSRSDSEYDTRGNVSQITYYNGKGKPTATSDSGYARERMVYDERGNLMEYSYFGTDLKPMNLPSERYHKCGIDHDTMGNITERNYFDVKNKPVLIANGYSKYKASFDSRGYLKERAFFGTRGEPVALPALGAHRLTQTCDDRGNVIEESNFDTDGKPSFSTQGIHKLTQKFDIMGNELEERYFGIHGEPIVREDEGAHASVNCYDNFGKVTSSYWLGVNDEPVDNLRGYHKVVSAHDVNGNVVTTSYFDHDAKPVPDPETGAPVIRRRFNPKNQLSEISYEDESGKPTLSTNGFARQTFNYDTRGNMTEILYFGTAGEPVLYKGGTRWVQSYDPVTNQPMEVFIYGLDGKLVEK